MITNKIILGNSINVLKKIPKESISLVVCSPPYKDKDNYSPELIANIFTECYSIQKKQFFMLCKFWRISKF